MLYKTKGVVFRFTKYGETSVIVSIFTGEFGLQSYIVNGVRSKSAKSKIALYQPLTLVELVVYHRENANLNRIREIKCFHPYQTIYQDLNKSTIAMFIAEVVNKTVKEQSHANELCEFLISSLITLDTMSVEVANFHLIFLIKLTRFLGFGAHHVNELLGGRVTDPSLEAVMENMLQGNYLDRIDINNHQRRELLNLILGFYNDHTGVLGDLKSLQVLREILA